jgi:uncharacterized protein (TIGR02996 family)
MSQLSGFLHSIAENPADDSSCLILADWLEEQDDPLLPARAELIRIQCELARWLSDLQRRTELQERAQELLDWHQQAWLGPLAERCVEHRFERGLLHVAMQARRFGARRFASEAADLFERALVGRVRLVRQQHSPGLPVQGLAAPQLASVAALDLNDFHLNDDGLRQLVESPHTSLLTWLDLSNNFLTDRGVQILAESPLARQLTWLDLRNNHLSAAGVDALLASPLGLRLNWLDLHGNQLDPGPRERLASWRRRRQGKLPAETLSRRITNSIGMEFVLIPAGTFLMGADEDEPHHRADEFPRHAVTITRPFYLGAYSVTQEEYLEVMGRNPAEFNPTVSDCGLHNPVERVSWHQAVEFCDRLSKREKSAGRMYRLPTEAEWEHACRAGTTTPFWCGGPPNARQCNYDGNYPYGGAGRGPYLGRTSIVGAYPVNPFGLYDMHGNVFEWCADYYDADYYTKSPERDPPGPSQGTLRVIRGGSWDCVGWYVRSAHRHGDPAGTRDRFNGFRVAMTASP